MRPVAAAAAAAAACGVHLISYSTPLSAGALPDLSFIRMNHVLGSVSTLRRLGSPSLATVFLDNRPCGVTPLHVACIAGAAHLVRLFLAAGGRPDVKCVLGWTPLHCAAACGWRNPARHDGGHVECAKCVRPPRAAARRWGGAGIGFVRECACVCLCACARAIYYFVLCCAVLCGRVTCGGVVVARRILLNAGADVNATDSTDRTPLSMTAKPRAQPHMARVLKEHGAR